VSTLFAAGPGRFWAQSAQKRERQSEAICCFFVTWITHDFTDFRSAKFHEICTQDVDLCRDKSFRNRILQVIPQGVFFQKGNVWAKIFQQLTTSGPYNSLTIYIDEKSRPTEPSAECRLSILTVRINSKSYSPGLRAAHKKWLSNSTSGVIYIRYLKKFNNRRRLGMNAHPAIIIIVCDTRANKKFVQKRRYL